CDTYRQHLLSSVKALSPGRVTTVFLGIATDQLQSSSQKGSSDFCAIYAGSLGHNYDIPTVLDAAKLLATRPIRFVIAGDGPLRDDVIRRIRDEKLSNTTYIGRVSSAELRAQYAQADVGLMPYASWST